jgi:hypothetical protein
VETDASTATDALTPSLHEKQDPLSLQQAGHFASNSSEAAVETKEPLLLSPSVTMDDSLMGEVGTGAGGYIMYKVDNKPREFTKVAAACRELELSSSPDSGTEMMSITVPGEGEGLMEPEEVSAAREAMAVLGAAKQRLEAQRKRVEKGLKENRAGMAAIREVCW